MKVQVTVAYIDKYSRQYCGIGDVLEYDKERAEELIKNGYAAKYKPTKGIEKATVTMDEIS